MQWHQINKEKLTYPQDASLPIGLSARSLDRVLVLLD